MAYCAASSSTCSTKITPITFMNVSSIGPACPDIVMLRNMPNIYNGSSGTITERITITITCLRSDITLRMAPWDENLATHRPRVKASISAEVTVISGAISIVKNGAGGSVPPDAAISLPGDISEGKNAAPVAYEARPASTVAAYASATVKSSILPARLPISMMAGATSPRMSSGMMNPRNWLNRALNVMNILAHHSGKMYPAPMPRAIDTIILGSSPNLFMRSVFMVYREIMYSTLIYIYGVMCSPDDVKLLKNFH